MTLQLQRADIFFTRGRGIFSGAIRFFTRGFGESRTKVNHVGLVVADGALDEAMVVEALRRVVEHRLVDRYGRGKRRDAVAVFRPTNLTPAEVDTIVQAAQRYVGKKYGALKILAHLADWALFGAYVFRRLARMDDYPICSWLVAHAFKTAGKHFGIEARAASPDDIWDFVDAHSNKYIEIRALSPL